MVQTKQHENQGKCLEKGCVTTSMCTDDILAKVLTLKARFNAFTVDEGFSEGAWYNKDDYSVEARTAVEEAQALRQALDNWIDAIIDHSPRSRETEMRWMKEIDSISLELSGILHSLEGAQREKVLCPADVAVKKPNEG